MIVTTETEPVFCIHGLPEEVIAVLFAYVSRNPKPIRENLKEILAQDGFEDLSGEGHTSFDASSERARKFHEKWVVGYGHASVAEHAMLHYGIEDISILATKVLEDARLASYTEKSTRYQFFDKDSVYLPEHLEQYRPAMDRLMQDYRNLFHAVQGALGHKYPPKPGIDQKAYDSAVFALTCDLVRGLLPAGTKTQLGMTVNAREAAYLTTKLLSHPLEECRNLGLGLKQEGSKLCPTLFRHAERSKALADFHYLGWNLETTQPPPDLPANRNGVSLVWSHPDRQGDEFLARILRYEGDCGSAPMKVWDRTPVKEGGFGLRRLRSVMDQDPHQAPPRAFEFINFAFEFVLDYGAFRDIQRHRIGTQISPIFTDQDGFEIPDEIRDLGFTKEYKDAIERAQETYQRARHTGMTPAQYLLPMAFRKRLLVQWNLREVIHFVKLRSIPQGHPSYRKLAWQVRQLVLEKYPELVPFVEADLKDYPLARLAQYIEG